MRLLITGMSGLLGVNMALLARDLYETSGCYFEHPVAIPGVHGVCRNLLRPGAVADLIDQTRPDIIINTVGLTSVDACERDPELAWRLNVDTAVEVAHLAAGRTKLLHISSDHIFDGFSSWHREDEIPIPVNVYAATKVEAERGVQQLCPDALIIRTNFYGWGTPLRRSFSDWILDGLRQGKELRMFRDVHFTPMLINDLVNAVLELVDRDATGIYHVAGSDRLSKLEFAQLVAEVFEIDDLRVVPTMLERSGLTAPRPKDMSLSTERVARELGRRMPAARDGLRRLRALEIRGWPAAMAEAVHSHASGQR